jgi:HPt (histidine-containing phosphotransfer) domain-containing protein
MQEPVNLTNLRSMIDGDAEMEKALFEEFFSSFAAGIEALQANCTNSDTEAWRKEAHALKGVALNLGAQNLGNLCKNGQDSYLGNAQTKEKILGDIREEYTKVKAFLQKLC